MANAEHVEIVRQGEDAIKHFRDKNSGVKLDLTAAYLSDADLTEANLSDANLSGANLIHANLSGANLSNANLSNANLRYARLITAKLISVNLNEAELVGSDLFGANLSGANLIDANMGGVNLSASKLRRANLRSASMRTANLSSADLSNANLRNAFLFDANLSNANLRRANLTGANLINANLIGGNLCDADLSEAEVGCTAFGNMDLSKTKGLDSLIHGYPSTIGIDMLFLSNGKIPREFLRGCGLPESLIIQLPLFMEDASNFYRCFISHSHEDKQFARQLHDRLQEKGIRCWLDQMELNPGEKLYDGIARGIGDCDKLLLCASKGSLTSWWVDNEVSIALSKERRLLQETQQEVLTIIPLDLDGYMFSDEWKKGYRQQVLDRVAADFRNWKTDADEFERQFERVVKALRRDGGKVPEPKSKLSK